MDEYSLKLTKEELDMLRDLVRFAEQISGTGKADCPKYKMRVKLAGLRPIKINPQPHLLIFT